MITDAFIIQSQIHFCGQFSALRKCVTSIQSAVRSKGGDFALEQGAGPRGDPAGLKYGSVRTRSRRQCYDIACFQ